VILLVSCLDPECLQTALLDVSGYPAEVAVPSFGPRMVCSACGSKRIDVRPNWKEQSFGSRRRPHQIAISSSSGMTSKFELVKTLISCITQRLSRLTTNRAASARL
jgi:hypothetical protein